MYLARTTVWFLSSFIACWTASVWAQVDTSVTVPAGVPLEVELVRHAPMRIGSRLQGKLVRPIFVNDEVALSAGTPVYGSVVALNADSGRRIDARLNGDFTPFHRPVVQFDSAELDGHIVGLATENANDGGPVLKIGPPPHGQKRRSILKQEWQVIRQGVDQIHHAIVDPGKGDRLLQLLYGQLPYHPERIEQGTVWNCGLTSPLMLTSPQVQKTPDTQHSGRADAPDTSLLLHAHLDTRLSSKITTAGDVFRATVDEPAFAPDHSIAIPQNSILIGTVTRAHAARMFGRGGTLRFGFRELQEPDGAQKAVTGSTVGAELPGSGANLEMTNEGQVKPKQPSKLAVPLMLVLLATRALDSDGSQVAGAAVGSNGIGLIGRLIGIAAGSRNLAAGIGFYGAGVSVYRRWIRRGHEVEFPRYSRIDVEISEESGRELMR